jgi:methylated-DNA-[protein]-cysteine S-methyltransferase
MKTFYYDTFPTAFGPFSVAVDAAGAVVGTAFGERTALKSRLIPCDLVSGTDRTTAVRDQLIAYFLGERSTFDVRLAAAGTRFQHRVWAALGAIPVGETRTYGQIATELGNPFASRAVGRANATNPICVIIPCHRVIGANGTLTGFAFGEETKRRLLALERSRASRAA